MTPTSRVVLYLARRLPRGYWPLLRAQARRDPSLQDLLLSVDGTHIPLRADLRETVFVPLLRCKRIPHQVGFDRVCARLIHSGETVFDIGANVGYTTAVYSELVGSEGHIVAVEPSPRTFRLLERSLSNVGNITLVPEAISATTGTVDFYVPSTLDTASVVPLANAEHVTVLATTLDDLCQRYGQPQFMKVDVEGYEAEVFSGGTATLNRADAPAIVFEALDSAALARSIEVLRGASAAQYDFMRIRNDGTLHAIDDAGTSDYVALSHWARARLQ